jgi:hypothetical protein
MGNTVIGAGGGHVGEGAGVAYSTWAQTIDGTARAFSTGNILPDSTDSRTWAKRVVVSVDTAWIRVRWTSVAPTTALGHALTVGDTLVLEGQQNIQNFQAINGSGVAGTIQVTAER